MIRLAQLFSLFEKKVSPGPDPPLQAQLRGQGSEAKREFLIFRKDWCARAKFEKTVRYRVYPTNRKHIMTAIFFIILAVLLVVRVWAAVAYTRFLDENPETRKMLAAHAHRYGGAYC